MVPVAETQVLQGDWDFCGFISFWVFFRETIRVHFEVRSAPSDA